MKLILVFSYRYDYNLVPDLLRNVEHFIDDYIAYDDRGNDRLWYHEGQIRNMLIEKAKSMGADWILAIDPDERLEESAGKKIRELINKKEKKIYGFNFREMWSPDSDRTDGIWGEKKKFVLFPVFPDQKFMNLKVHSAWCPINDDYQWVQTDLNIYHLKMIDPQNREDRKNLYKIVDSGNEIQKIGYDYLTDEENIEIQRISTGRGFYPLYDSNYKIRQVE